MLIAKCIGGDENVLRGQFTEEEVRHFLAALRGSGTSAEITASWDEDGQRHSALKRERLVDVLNWLPLKLRLSGSRGQSLELDIAEDGTAEGRYHGVPKAILDKDDPTERMEHAFAVMFLMYCSSLDLSGQHIRQRNALRAACSDALAKHWPQSPGMGRLREQMALLGLMNIVGAPAPMVGLPEAMPPRTVTPLGRAMHLPGGAYPVEEAPSGHPAEQTSERSGPPRWFWPVVLFVAIAVSSLVTALALG